MPSSKRRNRRFSPANSSLASHRWTPGKRAASAGRSVAVRWTVDVSIWHREQLAQVIDYVVVPSDRSERLAVKYRS